MSQWPFYDTDTYTRVYTLHGTLGYHCKCESMVALIVKPAKSKEEDKGKDKEKDKQKYEHWCELLIIKPRWQSSVAVAVRILLPPSCSCNQSLQLTSAGVVRFLICSVLFQYFLWICIFAFVFITAVAVRILLSPPALTINPQTDQYLIVCVFSDFFSVFLRRFMVYFYSCLPSCSCNEILRLTRKIFFLCYGIILPTQTCNLP